MKELIKRIPTDTALFTTLAIGWLMETTGITSSKANEDSSERKLRQGLAIFGLIVSGLYLTNTSDDR